MAGEHSILSPSKGAMILRCAASLAAGKGIKDEPSQYAAEGTAYHEVAAKTLQALQYAESCYPDPPDIVGGWECGHYIGQVVEADGFKFTIDEDNAAHAQTYVDAIRATPGAQYYEVRLDTSEVVGVAGQSGTGDAVTLDFEHDTIHVDDLKFGRGEVVFAENNEQLIQYGAAALRKFALSHDWKFVKLGIHQPRLHHYSEHTYTVAEIEAWVIENQPRFRRAFKLYAHPDKIVAADYSPGEKQCRWCPIRGSCAARAQIFMDQFPIEPQSMHLPPAQLDDGALAYARNRVDAIEAWCADIKAEAHTRGVLLGKHLPGWKVVIGRAGNRKWADESAAEEYLTAALKTDAYKPRQIISPADAEKKLKKHPIEWSNLQGVIVQAEGSKSLVRDDSPKQAVASNQVEFPVQAPT